MKIPTEYFTGVSLAIGDTYGDDVRGGDGVVRFPNSHKRFGEPD